MCTCHQNGAVPLLCNGTLRYPCYGFTGTLVSIVFTTHLFLCYLKSVIYSYNVPVAFPHCIASQNAPEMRQCLAVQNSQEIQ